MLFRSKSVTVTSLLVAFNQITDFYCNHTALFISAKAVGHGGGARQWGKKLRLLEPEMCRVKIAVQAIRSTTGDQKAGGQNS